MGVKHFFRVFAASFKISFRELEIYDKDFIFGIAAMLLEYAVGIVSIFFIFDYIDALAGWTLWEMLFLYGLNLTGFSLWSCFFINTITLPYYIQRGEFDRMLLMPMPPMLSIMLDGFDDDSWGELITGIILLCIGWVALGVKAVYLLALPLVLIGGCLIYAGISILLSTLSFFTGAKNDAANLTMDIREFAQHPITIYPKALRVIFTYIAPIACVAFIPGGVMLGTFPPWWLAVAFFSAVVFFSLSLVIWNRALRLYGSTGT